MRIDEVITSEAFRGDGALTAGAVWVLRFSGDEAARRAVRGLMDGSFTPEQEAEATACLYEIAHELDVLTTAARSLPA